jgi:hypothetical protein
LTSLLLATDNAGKEKPMNKPDGWRHMATAPKDGARILVTVRPVEQGAADVDVVYWARSDRYGMEGWRAADSTPGAIVSYAEPELRCWMPLPTPNPDDKLPSRPSPYEGEEIQIDGSGI